MATLKYRQSFEVSGTGSFPFDMLRYDACFPAREMKDSYQLVPTNEKAMLYKRTIRLCRYTEHKDRMPTLGRWKSFGWEVNEESIRTVKL